MYTAKLFALFANIALINKASATYFINDSGKYIVWVQDTLDDGEVYQHALAPGETAYLNNGTAYAWVNSGGMNCDAFQFEWPIETINVYWGAIQAVAPIQEGNETGDDLYDENNEPLDLAASVPQGYVGRIWTDSFVNPIPQDNGEQACYQ
ncbi:hypothetical protein BGZ63DRAFT_400038 [Mariannaea sp. PMI_226]|nr:hypothetical protein BGZ63DRAFT_400038 [Mariannaea sp. PMI_226]